MSDPNLRYVASFLIVEPEAVDFIKKGGFSNEERLETLSNENLELKNLYLKAQLDILNKEAEGLKETHPAVAERILHVAASIATIIGLAIQK